MNKNLWNKSNDYSTIVFEIQKAVFSKGCVFFNFGVVFHKIKNKSKYSELDSFLIGRYNQILVTNLEDDIWINLSVNSKNNNEKLNLFLLNIENIILPYIQKNILDVNFFLNNYEKILHENKLWLHKITDIELKNLLLELE